MTAHRAIHEPAREIPVLDEVDVLVVGGGVSGCAAAYAAGKTGAKTMLIERNGCLGGVATATLMANIGNDYVTNSGVTVIRGFAKQVLDRLVEMGGASSMWESRMPGNVIDSEKLRIVLYDMLTEAGVEMLMHAVAARPIVEGDAVKGVFIESRSLRQAILAKTVIDCSGELDITKQTPADSFCIGGASCSVLFKLANVDVDGFVDFVEATAETFPTRQDAVDDIDMFTTSWRVHGVLLFGHGTGERWSYVQDFVKSGEFQKRLGPAWFLDGFGFYALKGTGFVVVNANAFSLPQDTEDLDIRLLSKYEAFMPKACYHTAAFLKQHMPGFANADVAHVGTDLGIRHSWYITGRETVHREAHVNAAEPTYFDGVIGTCPVRDTQYVSGSFWRPFTFDIPFGVTVPNDCDNLLVGSGKSVGTTPKAFLRGMPTCMITGQAAGAAGGLAARLGVKVSDVPIRDIQRVLLEQGVYLGPKQRLQELGLTD